MTNSHRIIIALSEVTRMNELWSGGEGLKCVVLCAGEGRRIFADISKARKLLNYEPQGELSKLLPSLIDWWRNTLEDILKCQT